MFFRRCYSLVRKIAPDFNGKAVIDGEIKNIKKSDFDGKYWLLMFYPLDFTFVCPTELTSLNDRIEEFKKLECQVAAISTDSEYSHLNWTKVNRTKGGLFQENSAFKLWLISDFTKEISRKFNVLIEETGFPLRATFIVDKKGVVRHETVNDLGIGRSIEESLRVLQAIQHYDRNGELCPANWSPSHHQKTINTKNPLEFFEKSM